MNVLLVIVIAALTAASAVFLFLWLSLRASVREAAEGLEEKMSADTNTLISITSADRQIRLLASRINKELVKLKCERRKLKTGDEKLHEAITNISHDIRTPLTAVKGYLDLLEKEEKSEKADRYIAVIRERTEAMTMLTEELLEYMVASSENRFFKYGNVNVCETLEVCIAGFYGSLTEKSIVPQIKLPDVKVIRYLDNTALCRIFNNILNNAVKYSDGDLEIIMTEECIVIFRNTASGLDRLQTERLFDRFYTVENARKSTGLGLSIAKLLTEEMGGTIKAEYDNDRLSIILSF